MSAEENLNIIHDSQQIYYRSPFGAVAARTSVQLKLSVGGTVAVETVYVRLWQEDSGESLYKMEKAAEPEVGKAEQLAQSAARVQALQWYAATLTMPVEPGLVWYYFILVVQGQTWYYGNNQAGLGGKGQLTKIAPPSYQITVYRLGTKTPDWFKNAVVYQIYVDRFYRSAAAAERLNNAPANSVLHLNWDDAPAYAQDLQTGEILTYDYFGGNLAGVQEKLPYLQEMGVTAIYFNPLFASVSNHKYDTADYKTIDPMYGDNQGFQQLCAQAKELGIHIILDGVFSHTGADSIYFNLEGRYAEAGAYQSQDSPYFSWYRFTKHPDAYESWWGIATMPNVNELDAAYQEYMLTGADSVLRQWLRMGVKGWRLDVADELPAAFIRQLRTVLKAEDPEAMLVGEVWEDASHKVAYEEMRRYFGGDELDGVMNYPLRQIVLDFLLAKTGATHTRQAVASLYENYPRENFYALLNLLGSHDVPRILTVLGEAPPAESLTKREQARAKLSTEARKLAVARLKLAVLWQMTFPGAPCIYYGDEAGLEGYKDPLNRRTYPWGKEEADLRAWYQALTKLRNEEQVLRTGSWQQVDTDSEDVYGYIRSISGGRDEFGDLGRNSSAIILLNRSRTETIEIVVKLAAGTGDAFVDVLPGHREKHCHLSAAGKLKVSLRPLSGRLLLATEPEAEKSSYNAGVLLHLTSLPGTPGCGDLGPAARNFIDFLAEAGQTWWQFLPLNPPGMGDSPYQCLSAFAGNPLLLAADELAKDGLLTEGQLIISRKRRGLSGEKINFAKARAAKTLLLRQAFTAFQNNFSRWQEEYQCFQTAQAYWLSDYSLFMALKAHFNEQAWNYWPRALVERQAEALQEYREKLAEEIQYYTFVQFMFFRQWAKLHAYASEQGVKLFGDLPLFVAHDSADVWAQQSLFALDRQGNTAKAAGVPPDYFSATGQMWGNPQYNWRKMAVDDFSWWQERLKTLFSLVDRVRIDHFRGLEAYWEIPGGEATAVNGRWVHGPGEKFFAVIKQALGELDLVAEDLGIITPAVNKLKDSLGLPGMRVLQFAYGGEKPDFPYNLPANTIAYSGTHDNDTLLGWYQQEIMSKPDLAALIERDLAKLAEPEETNIVWRLLDLIYASKAETVIVPMQDLLSLGTEARMNFPGTVAGNWTWRLLPGSLTGELARKLGRLTVRRQRYRQ